MDKIKKPVTAEDIKKKYKENQKSQQSGRPKNVDLPMTVEMHRMAVLIGSGMRVSDAAKACEFTAHQRRTYMKHPDFEKVVTDTMIANLDKDGKSLRDSTLELLQTIIESWTTKVKSGDTTTKEENDIVKTMEKLATTIIQQEKETNQPLLPAGKASKQPKEIELDDSDIIIDMEEEEDESRED